MIQEKCKHCKYYTEGLDIDYVPSVWCKLNKFKESETCEHHNDKYTVWDYIEDTMLGWFILIGIGLFALIMTYCK